MAADPAALVDAVNGDGSLAGVMEGIMGTKHTHRIWEDSGAETFIVAESDKAARRAAMDWVSGGSYTPDDDPLADASFFADVHTRNLLTGETYLDEAIIDLSPDEPACLRDEDGIELEHDWREDGAWSVHGTQTVTRSACQRCGLLRRETSETTAGQLPHEPAKTSYIRNDYDAD